MQEELEQQQAEKLEYREYWALARRRYWYFLAPFFLGWAVIFAGSWFLKPMYRSGTLILVEKPSVPQQYVPTNISTNLQDQLNNMTQQILSRTRLLQIIEKLNLYPKERASRSPDVVVEHMRKDISIELVRSTDLQVTAFNVYYLSENPWLAQQATKELTDLFIFENLEMRRQQAENTTRFLASQLEEARKSLAAQEARLRSYKDEYLGELPGQLQSNLQILSGLQTQLEGEQDALSRAKQQNAYLESLLSQYQRLAGSVSSGSENVPVGLPAIDQELDRLRAQLADLSSHYTERHPDVRKLKDQIAKTERMKERITADLKAKAANPQNTEGESAVSDYSDPKQMAPVVEVRSQLQGNQLEIANRQNAVRNVEAKIGEYQARLNRTPVREQQLADITRDYDQSRANYDKLLEKRNESEMAENLEKQQQDETFRVIDPPNLPGKPYSPNRLKIAGMAIAIGLILGLVSAGGAEFLDDRIYKETELKKFLPAAVIAEIPPVVTPDEGKSQRREVWVAAITACVVMMMMLAGTAVAYLKR
jgi:polysaccharide biosynthesis transport protein